MIANIQSPCRRPPATNSKIGNCCDMYNQILHCVTIADCWFFVINLAVRNNNDVYKSENSNYLVIDNGYPIKLQSTCHSCQLPIDTSGKTTTMFSFLQWSRSLLQQQMMLEPIHAGIHQHRHCRMSVAVAPGGGGVGTHRFCCPLLLNCRETTMTMPRTLRLLAHARTMTTPTLSSLRWLRLLSRRRAMVEPTCAGIC